MLNKLLIVSLAGLAALAGPAQAQLVGDAVSEGKRLCLYRGVHQDRIVTLPSAERCPSSLSDLYPRRKQAPIPSTATLQGEEKPVSGKKACVYATATKRYVRWVSRYSHCPLTR